MGAARGPRIHSFDSAGSAPPSPRGRMLSTGRGLATPGWRPEYFRFEANQGRILR